jgi:hypothetical protein
MNKTKLAVFCLLILALCTQINVDAMNRGQGKKQGKAQAQNRRGAPKGGERRSRGTQGRGRPARTGGCKGSACSMRRGGAAVGATTAAAAATSAAAVSVANDLPENPEFD